MKHAVRLCTYVFGGHVERLKQTVKSLCWPENRKALEGAVWRIYTNDPIQEVVAPLGVDVEFCPPPREGGTGERMQRALVTEMEICASYGASLLTIQPDTVFGEGTIGALIKLGAGTKNAIAVPHPRVNLNFRVDNWPLSNARLVKMAFENMHPLWKEGNMDAKKNNVYKTGAGWREIRKDLYAVSVRIPTPYFVTPIREDITFLKEQGAGAWDHKWPARLIEHQRHRVVGSSDAAFMVELTEERPAAVTDRSREPDDYRGNNLNHSVNRNTLCIWRAE